MVFAAEWGTGQVLWSLLWLVVFFIWIFLLIRVLGDLIRSHDMSGWAKVLWTIALIVFPYLGVLVYLLVRGDKMAQHEMAMAARHEEELQSYIRNVAGTGTSVADELERLANLRERGVIDEAEFSRLKAKAMG